VIWFVVRLLIILLLVRLVWRFVASVLTGLAEPRGRMSGNQAVPLVRDPVCGTFVVPARALPLSDGRSTVYFCSERCRDLYSSKAQG
jgi:YHS domain-containing protein